LGSSLPASADVLSPFNAKYTVERGSLTLGNAYFSLSSWNGTPGCHVYHGNAEPRAILRLIVGDIIDDSYFCTDKDGTIQPQQFTHVEEGDAEDSHVLKFDWKAGKVTYMGDKARDGVAKLDLPKGAVDPFSLHMAARLWLNKEHKPGATIQRDFAIVDEDEIKHYTLAAQPGGVVKTPFGSFDTVKVDRTDNPDKHLTLWVAPKLDYLPIRVESHSPVVVVHAPRRRTRFHSH
jgi:hypothetical protein